MVRRRLPFAEKDSNRQSTSLLGRPTLVLAGVLLALGAFPASAGAHGPVAPVASSYLAKVASVPAGLEAKVVDGDQRMWMQVLPGETVVVLDYRGAPYLRFSRSGIAVNHNSAMYYLNQTPVAALVPSGLKSTTPPRWQQVSSGHSYGWHDGRLHALATVAVAPGVAYVGRWTIPVLVDGGLSSISGGLWHANNPALVWLWPIVVLLLCVVAAWRVRRPELDRVAERGIAFGALAAITVAALGQGLHGRPNVSVFQLIELGAILAFVAWRLFRLVIGEPGYFSYFAIAFVALWEGAELAPTLVNGFVLIATPAFVTRAAADLCFGCGFGLLLLASRIGDHAEATSAGRDLEHALDGEDDDLSESLV